MRLREITTEAWRNTCSGASRTAAVCLALTVAAATLLGMDTLVARAAIDEATSYQQAGAAIKTIDAADAIDAATCEAITSVAGVRAAGAIRQLDQPLSPRALPGSTLPAYEITPSFAGLLGNATPGDGILLSRSAAQRLGISAGDELPLVTGTAVVRGIYEWPDDGRRAGLGYAALIPTATTNVFDECWAEVWPETEQLQSLLRSTTITENADPSTPPVVGSINESLGVRFRGGERFADRITQYAPFGAILVAALITGFATRARRLELAAAQHFGVRRTDVLAITLTETAIALIPTWALSLAITNAIGHGASTDIGAIIGIGLHVIAGITAGALMGTTIATLAIRSGDLLTYFKNR